MHFYKSIIHNSFILILFITFSIGSPENNILDTISGNFVKTPEPMHLSIGN